MKQEIKDFILNLYPIPRIVRWKKRRKLKNRNFTILCSNCMGGIIYHLVSDKFLSPTVNLRIDSKEFFKFLNHMDYYMSLQIDFYDDLNISYPLGKLGDITIHFNHYHTKEEAVLKWEERKKRINWNNVYIITNDLDGVTEEDINSIKDFPCHNIIVFTHRHYMDIPYTYYVGDKEQLMKMLKKSVLTGLYEFERWFDYSNFLNKYK